MTTIAAHGSEMAADTQCTSDYIGRVRKIHKLPDGTLVGGAGVQASVFAAIAWLYAGRQGEAPDIENSGLLFLRPDGSIWLADGRWPEFPVMGDHYAIGSGATAAMVAMHLGKSAAQAVRIAALFDDGTSAPIHTLKLPKRAA